MSLQEEYFKKEGSLQKDMISKLIVVPIEKIQDRIATVLKELEGLPGIYVSLNKTQKSIEGVLKKQGINTHKIFFIDCMTKENTKDDVLYHAPEDLQGLSRAIDSFLKKVRGKAFLILDALSTFLIYNTENEVAEFIGKVKERASRKNVILIAFSPKTKGQELLEKIFSFFDEVEKS